MSLQGNASCCPGQAAVCLWISFYASPPLLLHRYRDTNASPPDILQRPILSFPATQIVASRLDQPPAPLILGLFRSAANATILFSAQEHLKLQPSRPSWTFFSVLLSAESLKRSRVMTRGKPA